MQALRFSNGDTMPQTGLGTWKIEPKHTREAVLQAIHAGYRHIDCAFAYGNEREVGQALAAAMAEGIARSELWVTSKLWNNAHHPDQVRPALEASCKKLGLDYLDLYLIHWPVVQKEHVMRPSQASDLISLKELPLSKTWGALEACVDAGLTRHIGVANLSVAKLQGLLKTARIKPEMDQVELHPYLQQDALLAFCRENGINVTAYSPLGSGDRPGAKAGDPVLLKEPVLQAVADRHGASPAQVLIAWALKRGTAVIPKSANPEHIRQNFQAQDLQLSAQDMADLAALDRGHRMISGDLWCVAGSDYTLATLWDE